ncbi:hypothetical protein [Corynebacterium meridianum]|uniref:Uncharacterized protein n=1 Tax=Corynebacterium meridianum TaxID=2765363 RepID=A0A934I5D3_9CORY|nr:hypothetical protein [Corynebacterium meridianum]MBI8988674.1 hypothetical protein [Corynebacterium meridianum]MCK7677146.1 hypothetical protein [Corynebacterium meridianum]
MPPEYSWDDSEISSGWVSDSSDGSDYAQPAPAKRSHPMTMWVAGAVIALLLVVVMVGAVSRMGSSAGTNASDQAASRSAGTGATGPVTSTETTTRTSTKPITPPAGSTGCGTSGDWDVYAATERTSCPFSIAVGEKLRGSLDGTGRESRTSLLVYSPVTEKNYVVVCDPSGAENYDCATTTDARVILIRR